ncbi:hypothetical protein A2716_00485 [candidate division WWE3 bacterium RIFCSPHIGHO2_01_FULL_40_23]|uniref:Uncharacterized protein n=1 Tax=candidate division WWE3 bacterium RIFCSPLOWO2_01_FULL_41_18 TaxID=1802625 RepID=A0A1F4VDZ1_UNCKA|nr:MAG: hypothetical protein A2716_00485 [candidate division WWE3 bacterium RIFCSPHIGHO2_01_FULL_40_23]OGC55472.1 MAG: hypothetical protein A3A78_00755 [candidate division WWE3 bacterium RIFCSPLOWO2_01_FULL_41_18]
MVGLLFFLTSATAPSSCQIGRRTIYKDAWITSVASDGSWLEYKDYNTQEIQMVKVCPNGNLPSLSTIQDQMNRFDGRVALILTERNWLESEPQVLTVILK